MCSEDQPAIVERKVEHYFDDDFIEQVRQQLLDLYLTNNNNSVGAPTAPIESTTTTTTTAPKTTLPARNLPHEILDSEDDNDSQSSLTSSIRDQDEGEDEDEVTVTSNKLLQNSCCDYSEEDGEDDGGLYDVEDIQLVRTDDWFIRRFLAWRPTKVHEATDAVHKALTWRKKVKIRSWTDSMYPAEFYQVAACFRYLADHEGNPVVIVRLRCNKKDSANHHYFDRLVKNYFVYVIEKIVSTTPNRGFGLIFDCHKAGLSNVDLDMARFIIQALTLSFSGCIAYVCIYELPWLFNQIWRMIRGWLDEDAKSIVKFHTKSDISKLIPVDNLPDYMGGPGRLDFRHIPKGVSTVEEMAPSLGIQSSKDIERLNQHFQKLIASTQS